MYVLTHEEKVHMQRKGALYRGRRSLMLSVFSR